MLFEDRRKSVAMSRTTVFGVPLAELPVYDFSDLISNEEVSLCEFVGANVEHLRSTLMTAKQWISGDPHGELLIKRVSVLKRSYAEAKALTWGVTPGRFLMDSVRRLYRDISTVLFHWTLSDTPRDLAENLIWDPNGMPAIETIRALASKRAQI